MKNPRILKNTLVCLVCVAAMFAISGCTAAQLGQADKAIGGTPLQPTTAPTTQPGVYVTIQPTPVQATIHLVQDGLTVAQPIVQAVAGPVWGNIAYGAMGLVIAALGVFGAKQTVDKSTANGIIAKAAPVAAAMAKQLGASQTIVNGITTFAGVAQPILDLLSHPAAAAPLAAAAAVSPGSPPISSQPIAPGPGAAVAPPAPVV